METEVNWKEARRFLTLFEQSFAGTRKFDTWGNSKFHLSDAANCTRRIWYRQMLANHPELAEIWGYHEGIDLDSFVNMAIGTAMHEYFQTLMVEKMHWCRAEDIEVPISYPDLNMKGSVDMIVAVERMKALCAELGIERVPNFTGSHIILDFKSKRDDVVIISKPGRPKEREHTFPKKVLSYPDAGYYTQLQSYMHFIPELYPERYPEINQGILLYFCKNDGRRLAIAMTREEGMGQRTKDKAARVLQYLRDRVAPPRENRRSDGACKGWPTVLENGTTGMKYGCPYYELCWSQSS